ncbi:hypothetical protein RHOER0001_3428 [Rhodococcus erythropolis SK121]|nr:hypothetical protein RHOER0001_3428 [Rhodococcus erythropolis SK121]
MPTIDAIAARSYSFAAGLVPVLVVVIELLSASHVVHRHGETAKSEQGRNAVRSATLPVCSVHAFG